MSAFSDIALPGRMPVAGSGRGMVTPETLFGSKAEKDIYQRLLDRATGTGQSSVSFKSVKVKIFDLSDPKQVEAYEKLWLKLLNKIARMEAVVDARTDLVRRADGTSYWMKYVEYTEFGDDEGDSSKDRKSKGRNGK